MKFGIRLPKGIPYGGLFEIFKNSIFFPENCVFRELGLRKNTATRRNTLVQHLGQTARPITIKIGVHLREGTPYGGFFPKILEIQIAFPQNSRFRMLGLGKNTPTLTKFGTSLRSNYWAQYNKIGMHHPEGTS